MIVNFSYGLTKLRTNFANKKKNASSIVTNTVVGPATVDDTASSEIIKIRESLVISLMKSKKYTREAAEAILNWAGTANVVEKCLACECHD